MKVVRQLWSIPVGLLVPLAALALSGCHPTEADYEIMDFVGMKVSCADLIGAQAKANARVDPTLAGHYTPVLMLEKSHDNYKYDYKFQQCGTELEADRHEQCQGYTANLRRQLEASHPSRGPRLESGHLPESWTRMCLAEIREGLAGVDDHYRIEPGTSPTLRMARIDTTIQIADITRLSRDLRDASEGLWRVDVETRSAGAYRLWFSNESAANRAYEEIGAAWRGSPRDVIPDLDRDDSRSRERRLSKTAGRN